MLIVQVSLTIFLLLNDSSINKQSATDPLKFRNAGEPRCTISSPLLSIRICRIVDSSHGPTRAINNVNGVKKNQTPLLCSFYTSHGVPSLINRPRFHIQTSNNDLNVKLDAGISWKSDVEKGVSTPLTSVRKEEAAKDEEMTR